MQRQDLSKIMFLDIETVPQTGQLAELSPELNHLWNDKFSTLIKRSPEKYPENCTPADAYSTNAGIFAEFGKIVCISVGFIYFNGTEMHFRTKSYCGDDEKELLTDFCHLLEKFCTSREHTLCGHNIKEFDIPYICRRLLINGMTLPSILQIAGKKPWEILFIDTLELWRFGDYKHYTALKTLTAVFGIPTPKDDIDGSQVAEVYYQEKNLERISLYCQKDVVATAQVFLKINGLTLIPSTNIEHLS